MKIQIKKHENPDVYIYIIKNDYGATMTGMSHYGEETELPVTNVELDFSHPKHKVDIDIPDDEDMTGPELHNLDR